MGVGGGGCEHYSNATGAFKPLSVCLMSAYLFRNSILTNQIKNVPIFFYLKLLVNQSSINDRIHN